MSDTDLTNAIKSVDVLMSRLQTEIDAAYVAADNTTKPMYEYAYNMADKLFDMLKYIEDFQSKLNNGK